MLWQVPAAVTCETITNVMSCAVVSLDYRRGRDVICLYRIQIKHKNIQDALDGWAIDTFDRCSYKQERRSVAPVPMQSSDLDAVQLALLARSFSQSVARPPASDVASNPERRAWSNQAQGESC